MTRRGLLPRYSKPYCLVYVKTSNLTSISLWSSFWYHKFLGLSNMKAAIGLTTFCRFSNSNLNWISHSKSVYLKILKVMNRCRRSLWNTCTVISAIEFSLKWLSTRYLSIWLKACIFCTTPDLMSFRTRPGCCTSLRMNLSVSLKILSSTVSRDFTFTFATVLFFLSDVLLLLSSSASSSSYSSYSSY